jgi:HK97 family phage prohead protease|nr:MAG TPA: head maturation protease [Caudoviricetes sp.]DAO93203.1 MAG TPA: head maturation protease [Caudoviricetes sp.]
MNIEVRADDTVRIEGYVNATEKKSRPVITPHGKCIEMVEERAFENAINRAGDVSVTVDHDSSHIYASTKDNTLKLYEDGIGLHADVLITDKSVVEIAKQGKIRGWSFGMYNVVDELEQRADGELPIRHIKSLDLDHITLVVNKVPCYSATSVEVRADSETDIETRAVDSNVNLSVIEPAKEKIDYSDYENRIKSLKTAE